MAVFLSWVDSDSNVSSLLLDASPGRTHTASAQVTEHPVEKGTPATDNIRPLPRKLSIEGFITNTPIGPPPVAKQIAGSGAGGTVFLPANDVGGGAGVDAEVTTVTIYPKTTIATYIRGPRPPEQVTALDFLEEFDRVTESFVSLVQAVQHGCLFDIATSLATYSNMAATSMTVTETNHAAQALQFTMEFQELRIVTAKAALVPPRSKKDDTGSHAPEKADAGEDHVLRDTVRAITNFFGVTSPDR